MSAHLDPSTSFAAAGLSLEAISHVYGGQVAVDTLSLSITRREIVCLLGPSGCGKSTTLRLAAGLERLQAGTIRIEDEIVARPGQEMPPEDRRIGLVFQDIALFPHLTVQENVTFGLRQMEVSARHRRVQEFLARVHLDHLADAYPHQLSGGEQQRVALCRALAPAPRVMLMDEPFSGLDPELRSQVRADMLGLLREAGTPVLLVTHEPEEALRMADRIALMEKGRIQQVGQPMDLYDHPASPFAARIFGEVNEWEVPLEGQSALTPFGRLPLAQSVAAGLNGAATALYVFRPQAVCIDPAGILASVIDVRPLGPMIWVRLQIGELAFIAHLSRNDNPTPGGQLSIRLTGRDHFFFPLRRD